MSEQQTRPSRIEIENQGELALRQLVPQDAQAYFDALWHDPSRFQHGEEATLKKYQTVEQVLGSIEDPEPDKLRFGIWDGNTVVGSVNIKFNRPGSAELGYWSGYGGHGYSERGARLLVEYAFDHYDIDKLTAWIARENIGSRKIIGRLGFTQQTSELERIFYTLHKGANQAQNLNT